MQRTPDVHILDTAEGDWGAHANRAAASRAVRKAIDEFNSFTDMPIAKDELTIIGSGDWCAQDGESCYYDRNAALITGMRTPPVWVHDFPSPPSPIYRTGGKRVARWRLVCSMSIDQAMTLWPFTGHPVALPAWHYDGVQADSGLCACTTRQRRKKGCIIGPGGRKGLICGVLYRDYGNIANHCLGCQDWLERREMYLADWAAQLVLL